MKDGVIGDGSFWLSQAKFKLLKKGKLFNRIDEIESKHGYKADWSRLIMKGNGH